MLLENIFNSLFKSSNYFAAVFPHLDERYFSDTEHNIIFKKIREYNIKYGKQPKASDIKLLIETDTNISEEHSDKCYDFIQSLSKIELVNDEELLIKETEKYAQDRALELAILDSVEIIQDPKKSRGSIEEKIRKALAVDFDVRIGHDYISDAGKRLKSYFDDEECIPLDIDALNNAMGGGLRRKSIAVFMAPPKRGKSLFLVHSAASLLRSGKNVLYLTCELSEKMISKRIDANMLDIAMNELNPKLDKNKFKSKFKEAISKTNGMLIVKEYAPNTLTSIHVKNLLHELKQKKNFIPDVIVIDYINICASSTLNSTYVGNTNLYIGKIVLEMRGVAVDNDLAILSAVQNNRGSVKKSTDVGMDDLADAFSIAMNVDWGGAIIQNDELRSMGKYLLKTVLTRWDENSNDIFTIGVEYGKMKLTNLDDSEQEVPLHIKDKLKYEEQSQTYEECGIDFT